jgi:hypothetical protein
MNRAFVLAAAALVALGVFAQDVFAQRADRRLDRDGFRAAAPRYVARPRLRVVVRPGPRYYAYPDYPYLPYVPARTPAFVLAGHAGTIDSCWGWDGYQWLNTCAGYYPGYGY